jgi:hypothetical protein
MCLPRRTTLGLDPSLAKEPTVDEGALRRWSRWFVQVLVFSVVVWLVTGAILGIPHGPGRSVESFGALDPILVGLNAMSFPVWVGSLAGLLGLVVWAGIRSLERIQR